jgi:nucleoside 2-deoxyribosyltransferase
MKAFISYSRNDAAFAASLRNEIERLGVTAWLDVRDMPPGDSVYDNLRQAIEGSDALILVVPETGTSQANAAIFEAGAAKALGKPVLAVMPDARGRELPVSVADFAILDALRKPLADVAKSLVHALEPA